MLLPVAEGSSVSVRDSIFWGNGGVGFWAEVGSTLSVTYTNSEDGFSATGNVSSDSGGRANRGAYGNTAQASRSGIDPTFIFADGFEPGDTSSW